jgi:hypothetical protein
MVTGRATLALARMRSIGKLHFMGGFVVILLAEKISHGGRIFVQVDALSPTA